MVGHEYAGADDKRKGSPCRGTPFEIFTCPMFALIGCGLHKFAPCDC